jgi:hypothetical protein
VQALGLSMRQYKDPASTISEMLEHSPQGARNGGPNHADDNADLGQRWASPSIAAGLGTRNEPAEMVTGERGISPYADTLPPARVGPAESW